MKVLLIDRNNFQRILEVDENMARTTCLPIQKLVKGLDTAELMEIPQEQRFEESYFVREGTTILNGEEIPILKERM